MFKALRVTVLLFILIFVALGTWRAKTQSVEWRFTLPVNIYLINADGSTTVADYLHGLSVEDFEPIAAYMREEADRFGRSDKASIEVRLGGEIASLPPGPPFNGSRLDVMLWSLKMRWWAFRNVETDGPEPQVKMFLLYFDPAQSSRLDHSTGLQKGLLGRVNLFASRDMAQQNNIVITHEFLHTLGATDKYDLHSNQPIYPDGYADPDLEPRLPQRYAEIMAGRTPLAANKTEMPTSLNDTLIGNRTAQEINWLEQEE
jgi:hypothetical protein